MFCKVKSAFIQGINAKTIRVEADVRNGLPGFQLVGAFATEAKESKERVRIALENSGYHIPAKKITINLAPADLKKSGTAFDLPIALAILAAMEIIPEKKMEDVLVVGELGLSGAVKPVFGVLPMLVHARENGFKYAIVPNENVFEATAVNGLKVYGVEDVKDCVSFIMGNTVKTPVENIEYEKLLGNQKGKNDMSEIHGQFFAKRALEIAASGMHNILLAGPPGGGKTMLAKAMSTILPELDYDESLEISKIYSVSGKLAENEPLVTKRPFMSPHHTVTATALTGGGRNAHAGIISLCHHGILFLDELPEFNRYTLETLRQPLEEKEITIARLESVYTFPASFTLVAAMNPCPCGFYPDRNRCCCTEQQIKNYLGKVSRPLLDRIDLSVEVAPPRFEEISYADGNDCKNETSAEIRKRIKKVHEIQKERYKNEKIRYNSEMTAADISRYCALDNESEKIMKSAYEKFELSARGYHRILKVARTIADMDGACDIQSSHLLEAIKFRNGVNDYV